MNYFSTIISPMLSFMLLLAAGLALAYSKVITKENVGLMSNLLMKLILPCLIFTMLYNNGMTFADMAAYRQLIAGQFCVYALLVVIGSLSASVLHLEYPTRNVHRGAHTCGNYAYIAIPLMVAMFDAYTQRMIPIIVAVECLFTWSLGVAFFCYTPQNRRQHYFDIKKILNPWLLTAVAALSLQSLGIKIPSFLTDTMTKVGECSLSVSLLYIGASLFFNRVSDIALLKPAVFLVIGRMLVAPLIVYTVSKQFLTSEQALSLAIFTATPTMAATVSIAETYRLDVAYATEAVFITTVACLFTIPTVLFTITMMG